MAVDVGNTQTGLGLFDGGGLRGQWRIASEVFKVPFYGVTAEMETGLDNRYDDPAAVGADRIVNAVAAGRHYGFPAIIVDIGTATTVEAVDGAGCYLGGAILTGLYVSLEALVSRTAKLPSVDLEEEPPRVIATNTPDSIRSGFIYGYAGAIDALIRRSRDELGEQNANVIATGGPASVIVPYCHEIHEFDPDLTLKGLLALYE